MATDAASGLAYLERIGYIHRDVAARNCIVAQDLTVKVTGETMSQCMQWRSQDVARCGYSHTKSLVYFEPYTPMFPSGVCICGCS